MEYDKAYVFHPENNRPTKRRRVEPQGLQSSWPQRKELFQEAWSTQHKKIDQCLGKRNAATIAELIDFLEEAGNDRQAEHIPTGVILSGPSGASQTGILHQMSSQRRADNGGQPLVILSSTSGTNLKSLLKVLIQRATQRPSGDDDNEETLGHPNGHRRKGAKLLNYDLELLHEEVGARKVTRVTVAFEDTESFDSGLLSELIELLACWRDRIPFVCLFSVATSVDFLQQRLSKAAVKCLDGRLFDVAPAGEELEQICQSLATFGTPLWLGADLMRMAFERQHDYIQGIDSFVDTIKYAYMSNYYANPLSVLLNPEVNSSTEPDNTFCEALRTAESFRTFARRTLDSKDRKEIDTLKRYLGSDRALVEFAIDSVIMGKDSLEHMMFAVDAIRRLQQGLPGTQVSSRSNLYVQAMAGKLKGSALLRSLLLSLRKAPSDVTAFLLSALASMDTPYITLDWLERLSGKLDSLLAQQNESGQPLRSEDDIKYSTLRTTVVAQKVELSKQKSALSEQDKAYTALLAEITEQLENFLGKFLIDPKELPFHEIFVYDLRSPYRETFTPRPRHAIERALAAPHDYLDCDCCAPEQGQLLEANLAATQPATAVLYQLYLESGSLINASDLWQAFQAVMGDGKDDERTMALFQRALAELRNFGMVKSTRKRVDHVAKVMWRGL